MKTLYPFQLTALIAICEAIRDSADLLLDFPTGSGKTTIIRAATASELQTGHVKHVLIAAPQLQIREGFLGHAEEVIKAGEQRISIPAGLIEKQGTFAHKQIVAFLNGHGGALAVTHQSLPYVDLGQVVALEDRLLVIDEAHHVGAPTLNSFVEQWQSRGGRMLFATATPYRDDGLPVRRDGMLIHRRSLAEHMHDPNGPYCPRKLENEIVGIELKDTKFSRAVFTGERAAGRSDLETTAITMRDKWVADGRPKLIVRVPPLKGGAQEFVQTLIASLVGVGARVLDATGLGKKDQLRVAQALKKDRGLSYAQTYDAIVSCERFREGSDWPVCSTVYTVGLPRALGTVAQLLGRATRLKIQPDYPQQYRDTAKITFFVPSSPRALDALDAEHSRRVLFLTSFLTDTHTAEVLSADRLIRDRFRSRGMLQNLGGKDGKNAEQWLDQISDPEYRAAASFAATALLAHKEMSPFELAKEIEVHDAVRAVVPENDRHAVAMYAALTAVVAQASKSCRRGKKSSEATSAPFKFNVKKLGVSDVLDSILEEFRDETISTTPAMRQLASQLHRLTGATMEAFTKKIREGLNLAGGNPITIEMVHEVIWNHYQKSGKWPTHNDFCQPFHLPYKRLSGYLWDGNRGLPGGSTLLKECHVIAAAKGVAPPEHLCKGVVPELSIEAVKADIRRHHNEHGTYPSTTQKHRQHPSGFGVSWYTLNCRLRRLHNGANLSKLISEIKVEDTGNLRIGLPEIERACREYATENGGRMPTRSSGPSPLGISFHRIDLLLKEGLPGVSDRSICDVTARLRPGFEQARPFFGTLTRDLVANALLAAWRRDGKRPIVHTFLPGLNYRLMSLNDRLVRERESGCDPLNGQTTWDLLDELEVQLTPPATAATAGQED